MNLAIANILPTELLEALAASPWAAIAVPAAILLLTTSIVTFSIPGALTPTAFLSGLLMGFGGILVVLLGVLVGSHILFLASRRWLSGWMTRKFGKRLEGVQDHLARKGPVYVVLARLGGVPHALVTGACAATPITSRQFLAASLLGMLPALSLATIAGSGLALL